MTDQLDPTSPAWSRDTWSEINRWESAAISLAPSLPSVAAEYEWARANLDRVLASIKADREARRR